jgi:hypothetical protein
MRKILLVMVLSMISIVNYAQVEEFTNIYSEWRVMEGDEFELVDSQNEVTFVVFNPNGKQMIRIIRSEDNIVELFQISEVEEGVTDDGVKYQALQTVSKNGEEIYVTLFDDDKKGLLLMFKHNGVFRLVNFRN